MRSGEVHMEQDAAIKEVLRTGRVIAMVGLSADEKKPSNVVARYMKGKGYRVIPVNPGEESVLGEKSYPSLADIPDKVDIVDIFMRAERVLPVVEQAVKLQPKVIWLQLGIRNDEAKSVSGSHNIMFVMDKCIKQEHARLFSA
jgi:predicted CoA-binding protein